MDDSYKFHHQHDTPTESELHYIKCDPSDPDAESKEMIEMGDFGATFIFHESFEEALTDHEASYL